MLSVEDNKLLTETGPNTLMGKLLRRYWIPALLSDELPEPDCPPVRVKLLGEKLIAFRDSNNKVGLLDELCPHRKASLFFGRNEEGGLRCVYHGWKFDTCGKCVDMPSEPPESSFKNNVTIKSYPCRDVGGIIWTYMGPEDEMPELPFLEWTLVPKSHRYFSRRIQENNYFQAIEGGIDSSHISFLHRNIQRSKTDAQKALANDRSPKFEVSKTDYGLLIGAKRKAAEGTVYWRITQFLMPWYTMIPPFGPTRGGHAWVPMDDEHCWHWSFSWNPLEPLKEEELAETRSGNDLHASLIPGTFRTVQNKDNDYQIDWELQASGQAFSGIRGIGMQDAAVQESAGSITDRSQEKLGTSDAAIIVARRVMIHAAKGLEKGETPPGLDSSKQRVRAASVMLPEGIPFQEGAKERMELKPQDYLAAENE
ncbi:Rieske 2Fe-2S domain-containing protein [Brevibacillus nitrificans]|uniref:Rieske 2Fe-2S domain-containing protein n=1 Tax=Brevibacillus nitrificans TaxID=651560 RepID=UPI002E1C07E5|nr:Rieske 2Fe-2S domain-containing protein [Brevibacillus nitrificans]